jgi:hypothetical protein
LIIGHAAAFRRARVIGATGLLLCCLTAPLGNLAQNPAPTLPAQLHRNPRPNPLLAHNKFRA